MHTRQTPWLLAAMDSTLSPLLSCGSRIGFLPEPPEGGGPAGSSAAGTGAGGSGTGSSGGSSNGSAAGSGESLDDVITMTRGDLERRTRDMAAREKEQGRRSGTQAWAEAAGYTTPDEILQAAQAHRQAELAKMSDADRIRGEAEEMAKKASKALEDANAAKFESLASKHLSAAGAQDPDLLAPALAKLGLTHESTDKEFTDAIDAMKQRAPGAFAGKPAGTPEATPGTAPRGGPTGGKSGASDVKGQVDAQLERMQMRRGARSVAH